MFEEACGNLSFAYHCMKKYTDLDTRDVEFQVGHLNDDLDLILGNEFMVTNIIFLIQHKDGILITDEKGPNFIASTNVVTGYYQVQRKAKHPATNKAIRIELK
ncbi:hypothetical protein ACH5RR_026289 [Cinchona calisaya]|uniref:Uncharacterized protein n=1 Tax=Cinchona calisaya TaxID=153742 RepID=A0ABD2Z656_9GENT